jgi:putative zinc finger/helix-turn-helix YgiT family protein
VSRRFEAVKFINECPHCCSNNVREQRYSDEVLFRSLSLDVEGLLRSECLSCNETWVTEPQAAHNAALTKIAFEAERNRLRERDGLLTGEQIYEIRKTLDLNQRQAASIFGGGSNAFNKYECGEVLQSFAMDRLLRLTHHVGDYAVSFLRNVGEHAALSSVFLKISDAASMDAPRGTFVSQLLNSGVRSDFFYEPEPQDTRAQCILTDMQPETMSSGLKVL